VISFDLFSSFSPHHYVGFYFFVPHPPPLRLPPSITRCFLICLWQLVSINFCISTCPYQLVYIDMSLSTCHCLYPHFVYPLAYSNLSVSTCLCLYQCGTWGLYSWFVAAIVAGDAVGDAGGTPQWFGVAGTALVGRLYSWYVAAVVAGWTRGGRWGGSRGGRRGGLAWQARHLRTLKLARCHNCRRGRRWTPRWFGVAGAALGDSIARCRDCRWVGAAVVWRGRRGTWGLYIVARCRDCRWVAAVVWRASLYMGTL